MKKAKVQRLFLSVDYLARKKTYKYIEKENLRTKVDMFPYKSYLQKQIRDSETFHALKNEHSEEKTTETPEKAKVKSKVEPSLKKMV